MARQGPSFRRTRRGDFQVRLSPPERDILRTLPGQLRDLLEEDPAADPGLARLHPPAHPEDRRLEAEYRSLVQDDLARQRREALDVMVATVGADRLDEDQLSAWLSVLNDLRLVLGTRLDVTEDMYERGFPEDDPRAQAFALYAYLGYLQEEAVQALAAALPEGGPDVEPGVVG
ncbi:MAG TPA: DUF2017 family protein [Actinomycetota bacterium]|nr:DUF2017 family protein [Actinomycetota bacterium]